MNKEAKFLGALLPSHPDLLPIIQAIREKYSLPEIFLDDDPIKEIFLGDDPVSFAEFRQDIKDRILEKIEVIFPEDFFKKYQATKKALETDFQAGLAKFPEELKPVMQTFFEQIKDSSQVIFKILDSQIDSITNVLYINLLLGEEAEAPEDWFGKVATMETGGETIIFAMASEVTNLDLLFSQIRELHKKTFGVRPAKLTNVTLGSAYYLQLTKSKKDKDFILDEYIRRNKFSLPKNRDSSRYMEVRRKYAERLKKRLQRTKAVLDVIVRDKK